MYKVKYYSILANRYCFSHLKVRIIEAIDDVPAHLSELLPFQQDAVEKAEGVEQLLVQPAFGAAVELSFSHQLVQTLHVGFHALRIRSR